MWCKWACALLKLATFSLFMPQGDANHGNDACVRGGYNERFHAVAELKTTPCVIECVRSTLQSQTRAVPSQPFTEIRCKRRHSYIPSSAINSVPKRMRSRWRFRRKTRNARYEDTTMVDAFASCVRIKTTLVRDPVGLINLLNIAVGS